MRYRANLRKWLYRLAVIMAFAFIVSPYSFSQSLNNTDDALLKRIADVPVDSILLHFGNEKGLEIICKYTTIEINKLRHAQSLKRISKGEQPLDSLTLNVKLTRAAQQYAQYMKKANFLSHTGKDGSTVRSRIQSQKYPEGRYGEVIGQGQDRIKEIVTDWEHSQGHFSVMVGSTFFQVGIGYCSGYWVADFGGF
jgi:hypothetical protein